MQRPVRQGKTQIEWLVVIGIVGVLKGFYLSAVGED